MRVLFLVMFLYSRTSRATTTALRIARGVLGQRLGRTCELDVLGFIGVAGRSGALLFLGFVRV